MLESQFGLHNKNLSKTNFLLSYNKYFLRNESPNCLKLTLQLFQILISLFSSLQSTQEIETQEGSSRNFRLSDM